MKLILTRHAKSDWNDPTLDDHDRTLNARGRHAAPLVGDWLQTRGHVPDHILCSTATRARETCELIRARLDPAPEVTHVAGLYNAEAEKVLSHLQKREGGTLMAIGHNPGFGVLARTLSRRTPDHPAFIGYPTAATLVLEFADGIAEAAGRVLDFTVPRDLED